MRGEGGRLHLLHQRAEVVVVHAGTTLAVDHAALALDHLRVEREVRHAVALEVEDRLQRAGREPVGVDGQVVAGAGVVAAARGFHDAVELARCAPAGAVEHHVFEVMRQPGDARVFVAAADLVEGVVARVRDVVVGPDHDLQPVRQRLAGDGVAAGHLWGGLGRVRGQRGEAERRGACQRQQTRREQAHGEPSMATSHHAAAGRPPAPAVSRGGRWAVGCA